jgi:hypothetical protein
MANFQAEHSPKNLVLCLVREQNCLTFATPFKKKLMVYSLWFIKKAIIELKSHKQ